MDLTGMQPQRRMGSRVTFAERPAGKSCRLSTARPASGQRLQGAKASTAQHAAARQPSGQAIGGRAESREQQRQPQQNVLLQAHAPVAAAALPRSTQEATAELTCAATQKQNKRLPPHSQLPAVARQAAVSAALALSAEHRELFALHKAAIAELQRTAGCLATAAQPGRQLALLRRHAELQAEVQDCSTRLEDKAVQLAALRRAGLL